MKKILYVLVIALPVILSSCSLDKKDIYSQIELANNYLNEMDYERAQISLKKILEISPNNLIANGGMLNISLNQEDQNQSDTYVQTILESYENINSTILENSDNEILFTQEEIDDAINNLDSIHNPEANITLDDKREDIEQQLSEDGIKITEDEVKKEFLIKYKPKYKYTQEDVDFLVSMGVDRESLLAEISEQKEIYVRESQIITQRMIDFIKTYDPYYVREVLSGNGLVVLGEIPAVILKNKAELYNENIELDFEYLKNITEDEFNSYVFQYCGGDYNKIKDSAYQYEEEFVYFRFAFEKLAERESFLWDNSRYFYTVATGNADYAGIDDYLEKLDEHPYYLWVGTYLGFFDLYTVDRCEELSKFSKLEYVMEAEVKYYTFSKAVFSQNKVLDDKINQLKNKIIQLGEQNTNTDTLTDTMQNSLYNVESTLVKFDENKQQLLDIYADFWNLKNEFSSSTKE